MPLMKARRIQKDVIEIAHISLIFFFKCLIFPTFSLFSGFFPVAVNFLRRVPIIGTILDLPYIRNVSTCDERCLPHSELSIFVWL